MTGIRISKRARREICDATGGIWMVFDRAGNVAAYGTPADYRRALDTAQAMSDHYGAEYIATSQPTVAECEAGFRAVVAS